MWLDNISEDTRKDVKLLREELIKAFTQVDGKAAIRSQLQRRRQSTAENIDHCTYTTIDLCHRLNPEMDEDEKVARSIKGLRAPYKEFAITLGEQHLAVKRPLSNARSWPCKPR